MRGGPELRARALADGAQRRSERDEDRGADPRRVDSAVRHFELPDHIDRRRRCVPARSPKVPVTR